MALTNSDKDKLRQVQQQDKVSVKDFDGAEFELLPEGNYLVQVDDLIIEEYQGTNKDTNQPYACDRLRIDLIVLEPKKYAGKKIKFNRINLFAKNEPEWARNKRLAFLTATGLVKKGDSAAVAAFNWASLQEPKPMMFVFEMEHKMGEDKDGNKKMRAEGKGFNAGFKQAALWGKPEANPPKDGPGSGAAAGGTTAGGSASKPAATPAAANRNQTPISGDAGIRSLPAGAAAAAAAAGAGKDYGDGL